MKKTVKNLIAILVVISLCASLALPALAYVGTNPSVLVDPTTGDSWDDVDPPEIYRQPEGGEVAVDDHIWLTCEASGAYDDDVLTYRWQGKKDGYSSWMNLTDGCIGNDEKYEGDRTNTLHISNVSVGLDYSLFRCKVTGEGGSVYSDTAVVTVKKEYDEAYIYNIVVPQAGLHPDVSSLECYVGSLSSARWHDVAANKDLTENDTFEAGKTYALWAYLYPPENCSWKVLPTTAYYADATAYCYASKWSDPEYLQTDTKPGLSYNSDGTVTLAVGVSYVCTPVPLPVITEQPKDTEEIYEGDYFTFTCKAEGEGLKYHWVTCPDAIVGLYEIRDGLYGQETFAGIDTPVLHVEDAGRGIDGAAFQCVVTNEAGKVKSNWAYAYTSKELPEITKEPEAVTVAEGATAVLTCEAKGTNLSYRWIAFNIFAGDFDIHDGLYGGEKYEGIYGSTLTIANCAHEMNGLAYYACIVSNIAGSVTSEYVAVETSDSVPVITVQPEDVSVKTGDDFTLRCEVESETDVKYEWFACVCGITEWMQLHDGIFNSESYSGINTNTLEVKNAGPGFRNVAFCCFVSNKSGSAKTDAAYIEYIRDEETVPSFTDVPETEWYANDVDVAYSMGLINGKSDTSFDPDNNLTYAEAIKLAACMNQLYKDGEVTLVNGSPNWYSTYMDYCLENKIIDKDLSDLADTPITREDYVELFYRAYPNDYYSQINNIEDGTIPDVSEDNEHKEAIYSLYRAGVLTGSDGYGTFNPRANIKRCEVAAVLNRCANSGMRKPVRLIRAKADASGK